MSATTNLQLVISAKDNASATLRSVGGHINSLGSSPGLHLLGSAAKVATAAVAGLGAATIAAGIASIKSAADFESTRIGFDVLLKSGDKAREMMKQIQAFADKTPFEFPDVAIGAQRLLAFGVAQEEVIPKFQQLGDIALGQADKLDSLIRMYGKVKAKGSADMEALNIAMDAGVPILQGLADHFGKTQAAVLDMVSAGKVKLKDLEAVMSDMTKEGGMFYEGMARQATSFKGLYSTMSDSLGSLGRQIVGLESTGDVREGSIFWHLKNGVADLIAYLTANKDKIANYMQGVIDRVMKSGEEWIKQMGGPEGIKNKIVDIAKGASDFAKNLAILIPKVVDISNKIADVVVKVTSFTAQNPELAKVLFTLLAIAGSAALFNPIAGVIVGIISIFNSLIGIVRALKDIWVSGMQKNRAELETLWINAELASRKIRDAFSGVGDRIRDAFGNVGDWVRSKFDGLKSFFSELADKIVSPFKNIGDRIENAFGDIGGVVSSKLMKVQAAVNGLIAGYNRMAQKVKLPTIPEIGRQFGGYVEMGRPVLVGEHGPEVFVPSQSGSVRPNAGASGPISINFNNVSISNEADEDRLAEKIRRILTNENNLGLLGIR